MSFVDIRKEIAKEISEILNVNYDDVINLVQKSKIETADIESRVAFRYSKQLNKNPIEIAEELPEVENVLGMTLQDIELKLKGE